MAKSPDAFRTISEVADWLETPAHVLRFWESKFSQIKPVKRAGGRRYYRPADMLLIGGIKTLLHDDGMTIKGVQKLLRDRGVRHVASLSQPLEDGSADDPIDLLEDAADQKADVLPFRGGRPDRQIEDAVLVEDEDEDEDWTAEPAAPSISAPSAPSAGPPRRSEPPEDSVPLPSFMSRPAKSPSAPRPPEPAPAPETAAPAMAPKAPEPAPPPKPRPRLITVPDDPDPDDPAPADAAPGLAVDIARLSRLSPAAAGQAAPLLDRLEALCQKMQGARTR